MWTDRTMFPTAHWSGNNSLYRKKQCTHLRIHPFPCQLHNHIISFSLFVSSFDAHQLKSYQAKCLFCPVEPYKLSYQPNYSLLPYKLSTQLPPPQKKGVPEASHRIHFRIRYHALLSETQISGKIAPSYYSSSSSPSVISWKGSTGSDK